MKRKLIKLKYMCMSTRTLLLLSEEFDEWHNLIVGEELADRYPDDLEFELLCSAINNDVIDEESKEVDISEILRILN